MTQEQPMDENMFNSELLDKYQEIQLDHDLRFHPDILSLGVSRRMSHITLHLMKYLGKLVEYPRKSIEADIALTDSFIMLTSAANLLGLRLSDLQKPNEYQSADFTKAFIGSLAKLAKACEACDHQEDFPIRETWNREVIFLFQLLHTESEIGKSDLLERARFRLNAVEGQHALGFILRPNS